MAMNNAINDNGCLVIDVSSHAFVLLEKRLVVAANTRKTILPPCGDMSAQHAITLSIPLMNLPDFPLMMPEEAATELLHQLI